MWHYACPAINLVLEPTKLILIDAKLAFLPHLRLLSTYHRAWSSVLSFKVTYLRCHTLTFFDILRSLKTLFRYNFANYYKYYPINGCQTGIICQKIYTSFQNECPDWGSVIGGMPVTMSHTNSGLSEYMVQNHFCMFSFTKTYPTPKIRQILAFGCQKTYLRAFKQTKILQHVFKIRNNLKVIVWQKKA